MEILNRVARIQKGKTRYYQPRGTDLLLPSVTGALGIINKPALIGWASRATAEGIRERLLPLVGQTLTENLIHDHCHAGKSSAANKKETAASFGSRAHELIERILKGENPEIEEDVKPAIDSFQLWWIAANLELEFAELMVASQKYGYGGTIDVVASRLDTRLPVLVDWKTNSNGLYVESALQAAAYAAAYAETFAVWPTEVWVVRLGKDKPEFEARRIQNIHTAFQAFLAALNLWKCMDGIDAVWGDVL